MGQRVPFVYHLALLCKTGQNQVQRMRITKTKRPACPKQADCCLTTVFPHPKSYQDFRTGPNPVSQAETPARLGEEMPLLEDRDYMDRSFIPGWISRLAVHSSPVWGNWKLCQWSPRHLVKNHPITIQLEFRILIGLFLVFRIARQRRNFHVILSDVVAMRLSFASPWVDP